MINKEKISIANNVKKISPVYKHIAEGLSEIDLLKYVKIYNGRIKASNQISSNGKLEPITKLDVEKIVGVELLIDVSGKEVQFYSITSATKGYGEKMVVSVLNAAPKEWKVVVVMDFSGGFWEVMANKYPRLMIL